MSSLSNKDFLQFVPQNKSTQSAKNSEDDGMMTFAKLSSNDKLKSMRSEIQQQDNVKKSRKKNPKKKKKEKTERSVSPTPRYRDRAKERREGKTEDIDIDEFLQSQANQPAVSVFGDAQDTSLKSQRALLQHIEADRYTTKPSTSLHELVEQESADAEEGQVSNEMEADLPEDPNSMGNRVLRVLNSLAHQQVTPVTDVFLQGRSSYVFDTSAMLGHDIPTTLIRSKADSVEYYGGEELPYAPSLPMQEIVVRCMKEMRESRERPERKVVLETQETEQSDSDDDDIFADVGDCDNAANISEVQKSLPPANSPDSPDAMDTDQPHGLLSAKQRAELEKLSQSQIEAKRKALQKEEEWNEEYLGPKSKGLRQEEYTNFAFDTGSDDEANGEPLSKRQRI